MIEWIQTHWGDILQIVTSVIGVASIIVKITPNVKDDAILGKIVAFISKYIALNVKK